MLRLSDRRLRLAAKSGSHAIEQIGFIFAAAAIYGLTVYLCMRAFFPGGAVGLSFWPPAGVAAAFAVRWNWRIWPGLIIAGTIATSAAGVHIANALPHVAVAAFGAELGAWAYLRMGGKRRLADLNDFIRWILVCGGVTPFGVALVSRGYLLVTGRIEVVALPQSIFEWWIGDSLGVISVGTAALALCSLERVSFAWLRRISTLWIVLFWIPCFLLAIPIPAVEALFGDVAAGYHPYILFPAVIVASVWFGVSGAALCALLVVATGLMGAAAGIEQMLLSWQSYNLQLFIGVVSFTGFVTAFLTQERRVLRASMESAERLSYQTIHAIRDGIAVFDRRGVMVECNEALEATFGFRREDLIGMEARRPYWLLWDESGAPLDPHHSATMRALDTGMPSPPQLLRCVTAQREIWIEVSSAPIRDGDGILTGAVTVVRDETNPMVLRTMVENSGMEFSKIADELPVLIYMTDVDGNSVYHNRGWGKFLFNHLERPLANWRDHVAEADLMAVAEREDRAFALRERYEERFRLRRHDGVYVWFLDIGVPRFDQNGVFLGYIGCMVDIDEEQALKSRISELADITLSSAIATRLLEQLGDRLEISVAAIRGEAGARMMGPEGRGALSDLEDIERRARAFVERRSADDEAGPCAVREVMEATTDDIRQLMRDDWSLTARIEADVMVPVNRRQLSAIAMNLVKNAREAMPSGGEIELSVQELSGHDVGWWTPFGAGWLKIEVRDRGIGISPEDLPRVTRPFWTKKPGTIGLGLPMVDMVIREAGGRLDIESQPGRGTTVKVFLPVWRQRGEIDKKLEGIVPIGHGEKVVIALMRDNLASGLEDEVGQLGYVVARSYTKDLGALCRSADLVIADPMLVGRMAGGAEETTSLADNLLWISGMSRADLEEHRMVGADDVFLRAPYSLNALGTALRDAMARGRASLWRSS